MDEPFPLERRLFECITDPASEPFDQLALDIFAYQYDANIPYRHYCDRLGHTPPDITHWREIPAVPTAAFKVADLTCRPHQPSSYFLTSGTTDGDHRRGRHLVANLAVYETAAIRQAQQYLFPDCERMTILSLTPPPYERPHSSLIHMIDLFMKRWGSEDSDYYASAGGLDVEKVGAMLRRAQRDRFPVACLGTTAAFALFFEHCATYGWRFALPPGSRLMDTGGSKDSGRNSPIDRNALVDAGVRQLGIAPPMFVNEYGMTELCSQFYDSCLADVLADRPPHRGKTPPHWVRTRVVDPATGHDVPAGQPGLLCHLDLANLHSVMAIQTDDLGIQLTEDGGSRIDLIGRSTGAEPRGCSQEFTMTMTHSR